MVILGKISAKSAKLLEKFRFGKMPTSADNLLVESKIIRESNLLERTPTSDLAYIKSKNSVISTAKQYVLKLKTKRYLSEFKVDGVNVFGSVAKNELADMVKSFEDLEKLKLVVRNNRQVSGDVDVFEVVKNMNDKYSERIYPKSSFNKNKLNCLGQFNKHNLNLQLSEYKDFYGRGFTDQEVKNISQLVKTPEHGNLLKTILNIRSEGDFPRSTFSLWRIESYANKFENSKNVRQLNELLRSKNKSGKDLFNEEVKENILEFLHSDKDIDLLSRLNKLTADKPDEFAAFFKSLSDMRSSNSSAYEKFVDSNMIGFLESRGSIGRYHETIGSNKKLLDPMLEDVKKIKSGESIIKQFDSKVSHSEVLKQTSEGNVVEIGNRLFVHDNGNLTQLQMTKEKFLELFPPQKRYVTLQGKNLGNCWLPSGYNNLVSGHPVAETALYKLFRQDGNDIYVKFPSAVAEVKFPNSQVNISKAGRNMEGGAKGAQMVEQAFSFHRNNGYSGALVEDVSAIKDVNVQMKKLETGNEKELHNAILNTNNTVFKHQKFEIKSAIEQYANDQNMLVHTAFVDPPQSFLKRINDYDIRNNHGYAIKGYNEKTGMVSVLNPWHPAYTTEIPIYDFSEYARYVHYTKVRG